MTNTATKPHDTTSLEPQSMFDAEIEFARKTLQSVRYGVAWTGDPKKPTHQEMSDGHWIPWHVADRLLVELKLSNKEPLRVQPESEQPKNMLTKDQLKARYEIDWKWRDAWTKLACRHEPGRLQVRQEKIERKAAAANRRIGRLIKLLGEQTKLEQAAVSLVDGKWYWVRRQGFGDVVEAPAKYREDVDCFYSYEFAGIPTRHLTVLREA
jgi:hypothetical protein